MSLVCTGSPNAPEDAPIGGGLFGLEEEGLDGVGLTPVNHASAHRIKFIGYPSDYNFKEISNNNRKAKEGKKLVFILPSEINCKKL